MNKIYLSALMLFWGITCYAQWGQANTGIANLTLGAKLLGSSDKYLFSGTLGGGKMYRSNDNGNNWSEIQPPVAGNVPECGFYLNGKYFSGLNSSMDCIFYTTNSGTSWNAVSGGPQTTVVTGFISLSGNIFAYTTSKGIYKSTDAGASWSASNNGLTNLSVSSMETINSKVFAVTNSAGVFVSTDNGTTWVQSNSGINGGDLFASLIWRMGNSLYYYAQGGSFYTSSNDGSNWSVWSKPGIIGLSVNEVYRNGSNLYLETRHYSGGLMDSLYFSSNEGTSWKNITANLSATNLNASGITEFGGFAFIAYNLVSPGLGIYKTTMTVGVNEDYSTDIISIYPIPFNEKIVISNISNQTIKKISIFDNQGKLVLLETDNNSPINTLQLIEGMYFMEITFGNNSTIQRKLIKVYGN